MSTSAYSFNGSLPVSGGTDYQLFPQLAATPLAKDPDVAEELREQLENTRALARPGAGEDRLYGSKGRYQVEQAFREVILVHPGEVDAETDHLSRLNTHRGGAPGYAIRQETNWISRWTGAEANGYRCS